MLNIQKTFISKEYSQKNNIEAFIAIIHNNDNLTDLPVYYTIKNIFALLLFHHCLSDKEMKIYDKLSSRKKAGFLFNHLLKTSSKVKIPTPLIKNLIEKKNNYDQAKKDININSFKEDIQNCISQSNYGKMKNLYYQFDGYEKARTELQEYTILVIVTINWISNKQSDRRMKIEKIFNLD